MTNLSSSPESASNLNAGGSLSEAKMLLRREKRLLRKQLSPEFRAAADASICLAVAKLIRSNHVKILAAYLSDGTEPDLAQVLSWFLKGGGELYLPRFETDGTYNMVRAETISCSPGKWGIPEPGPDAKPAPEGYLTRAFWLIPGVAFDSDLNRLGRGKGIYDRLLSAGSACAAGIFYDCQKCTRIPREPHDRSLDLVVTESGIHIHELFNKTGNGMESPFLPKE